MHVFLILSGFYPPMYYDGCVHIENDDQCYSCKHYLKGVSCPLLEALALGVVTLDSDIQVNNCGFYTKFERRLKIVEEDSNTLDSPSITESPLIQDDDCRTESHDVG